MKIAAPSFDGVTGRVRVVPNRNTFGLCALIVAMWYAGASQNNGAAYLLCFVVTGVAIVSILHTRANLRGLRVLCGPIAPAFEGEIQRVKIGVLAADGRTHAAVRIKAGQGDSAPFPEISGPRLLFEELAIESIVRGRFDELKLVASSLYPLGFFSARMTLRLRQTRWIYPAAEGTRPFPRHAAFSKNRGGGGRAEGDDFAGVRAYIPGEPQRHIDWKAAARGQGLFVKQWAGEADDTLRFTWEDTDGLAWEARLSQLTRWIVSAERSGRNYALEVPGKLFPPASGEAHFHECLRTLALFPAEGKT